MKRLLVLGESRAAIDFARDTCIRFDTVSLPDSTDDALATAILARMDEGTSVAGPSNLFDILARVAGALDLPLLREVDGVDGDTVRSGSFDGRLRETIKVTTARAVFSVNSNYRSTASAAVEPSAIDALSVAPSTSTHLVSRTSTVHQRPPLHEARVVVAGGRSLKDSGQFEQYLGKVVDKLGAAIAASGGAVHSGIASSTQLVGQTGSTVAPELYIAVGISGADQHVGGMQDSRVIVAINRDPHASIFRIADYGLVADLREALPELAEKL